MTDFEEPFIEKSEIDYLTGETVGDGIVDKELEKNSNLNDGKPNKSDWFTLENPLSTEQIDVVKALVNYVTQKHCFDKKMTVLGDDFYKTIRPLLTTAEFNLTGDVIQKEKKSKDKKDIEEKIVKKGKVKPGTQRSVKKIAEEEKQMSKTEKFQYDNGKTRVVEKTKSILQTLLKTEYGHPSCIIDNVLEFRGIAFLYIVWILTEKKKLYDKLSKIPFVFSVIMSFERFCTATNGYIGKNYISNDAAIFSTVLSDDLQKRLDLLKKTYSFSGLKLQQYAPHLLIYSDFDYAVPMFNIKPYDHQCNMIEQLKTNFETGILELYPALPNTGKTASIVMLAELVRKIRFEEPKKYGDLQAIFACNLPTVKVQAGQWLFNVAKATDPIPFGIGYISTIDGRPKVVNHNNCKDDSSRHVIICSPNVAQAFLLNNSDKYILFLDEPTVGADSDNFMNPSLKQNVSTMMNLPKWSILSSATLPTIEKMKPFIDDYKIKFPEAKIVEIISNKIPIGISVYTHAGEIVVPHLNCKTQSELKHAIDKISRSPFLGRMYTSNVVQTVWKNMVKKGVKCQNIDELFNDVKNLTTDRVKEIAIDLLKALVLQKDSVISDICSSSIMDHRRIKEKKKVDDDDILWEDETLDVTNCIKFNKLGTTEAHKFDGQTLIVSSNAVDFALENFRDIIDIIKKEIRSMKKFYDDFNSKTDSWKKDMDRIEKIDNEIEKSKYLDTVGSAKPVVTFPSEFQINTSAHISKYAKGTNRFINPTMVRSPVNFSEVKQVPVKFSRGVKETVEKLVIDPTLMNVIDEIIFLLFAGVGIYAPSHLTHEKANCRLTQIYLNCVLNLARDGKLAYFICDSSICYGTNYPIKRTILAPDFATKIVDDETNKTKKYIQLYSINSMNQLLSRAGRRGNDTGMPEGFVDEHTALRLIQSCKQDTTDEDIEIDNMLKCRSQILLEIEKHDNDILDKLFEEDILINLHEELISDIEEDPSDVYDSDDSEDLPVNKEVNIVTIGSVIKRNTKLIEEPILKEIKQDVPKATTIDSSSWRRDIKIEKEVEKKEFKKPHFSTKQKPKTTSSTSSVFDGWQRK